MDPKPEGPRGFLGEVERPPCPRELRGLRLVPPEPAGVPSCGRAVTEKARLGVPCRVTASPSTAASKPTSSMACGANAPPMPPPSPPAPMLPSGRSGPRPQRARPRYGPPCQIRGRFTGPAAPTRRMRRKPGAPAFRRAVVRRRPEQNARAEMPGHAEFCRVVPRVQCLQYF